LVCEKNSLINHCLWLFHRKRFLKENLFSSWKVYLIKFFFLTKHIKSKTLLTCNLNKSSLTSVLLTNDITYGIIVMGSGQIVFDLGQGGSAIFGSGSEIPNISPFYPSGQKKSLRVGSKSTRVKGKSASYLLWVQRILGAGRVRAHLYRTMRVKVKF